MEPYFDHEKLRVYQESLKFVEAMTTKDLTPSVNSTKKRIITPFYQKKL